MSVKEEIVDVKCEVQEAGGGVKEEMDIGPTVLQLPGSSDGQFSSVSDGMTTMVPEGHHSFKSESKGEVLGAGREVKKEADDSVFVLRTPKLESNTVPSCGQFSSASVFEAVKLRDSLVTFKDVLVKKELLDCDPLDGIDGEGLEVGGQVKTEVDIGPVVLQPSFTEPGTSQLNAEHYNYLNFKVELSDSYVWKKSVAAGSMIIKSKNMCEISYDLVDKQSAKTEVHDDNQVLNMSSCNYCPEKFNSNAELSIHLKSHTDFEMSEDITQRNAQYCKKYRERKNDCKRKKSAVKKKTNSEYCRMYRQRKKLLAQKLQSENEGLHTLTTSSLQMTFEPQPLV